jgi:DNA ligase-1
VRGVGEVCGDRHEVVMHRPVYNAAKGLVPGDRGLSIRFPRFIKLREDKGVEQATTPQDLANAWHRQVRRRVAWSKY